MAVDDKQERTTRPCSAKGRLRSERIDHAQPQGPAQPHRLHQGDAEDHQGHADGRGVEAAPRAGGGRGRAALCRAHGQGARQHRGLGRRPRFGAGAAARHRRDQVHLLVVCTAERGLCGAVQLRDRAAGARARQCADRRGQGGQDSSASAARATSSCAASTSRQIVEHIELRAVRTLGFEQRRRRSPTRSSRCSSTASSTSARCSSRASSR